jgi:hypothetical protein
MPGQNFKNHNRYYIPHHLIFYPLLLIALITSVVAYNYHPEQQEIWIAIIAIFIFIGWLSYMMRHVELNTLVDRAVNENLTPKQIKKMIVNWLPDHMRVY